MSILRALFGISSILFTCFVAQLADGLSIPIPQGFAHQNATGLLSNASTADPDPRFRMTVKYGTTSISSISLLMNAINGQAILAHQTFGQKIRDVPDIKLPGYQDVVITISARFPYRTFVNSLAVWGLYDAIRHMVTSETFKEALFDLWWNDKNVAYIIVAKPWVPQTDLDDNLKLISRNLSGMSLAGESRLQAGFQYVPYGSNIGYQEVFMVVLSTLRTLAHWSDTNAIYPFASSAEGCTAVLQVNPEPPPRTKSPVLLTGWVISAVSQIPKYMLMKHNFADLNVIITFEHVRVGDALIYCPLDHRACMGFPEQAAVA